MRMVSDEELNKFVEGNKALIEKIMAIQKDNLEYTSEFGKKVADQSFESARTAGELARKKSEEFFKATYETITNPDVQQHFMNMGTEFLAGLTAFIESVPSPESFIGKKEKAADPEPKKQKIEIKKK